MRAMINDRFLEQVNGGITFPSTHEEIDIGWDTVQYIYDNFGPDNAAIYAYETLDFITDHGMHGWGDTDLDHFGIDCLRGRMHRLLDNPGSEPYVGR